MPREGAIIFRDLVGKLDVLNIECEKCSRRGRYRLDRLVEHKFPHQTAISKPIMVILHRTSWERRSTPSWLALRRRCDGATGGAIALLRQIFLVQRAGHRELWIDNVGDVEVSCLPEQLHSIVLVETVVADQPVDHINAGKP